MLWTNNFSLPNRVIRVITGKYKDQRPELNRLSITDLIDNPLPRILFINHWDEIVRDYSDMLTMVQGIALHSRYEMCATDDEDAEHKFEDAIDGIIVVGKADSYVDGAILEVKQTGVYGPKYRLDKWTKQMNCYAWQRHMRGEEVNELLVDVWYRDWKQGNVGWRDYPPIPYEYISLDLWDFEKQNDYIYNQVAKHLAHPIYDMPQEYDKPCSDVQRGIRWEIYKGKNKTPTKVENTFDEATKWCQQQSYKFDIRKSEPVFCKRFCKSRSICPFLGVKQKEI
uniref:PD-(D/E)XK nuclease superfamily protein n=1 Tax=viral metagenome TaxID=1070528 RepID=A0A6H1ZZ60_9ZZZZ